MCGIGGVILLDKRKTFDKDMQVNALSLLMEIQDRGKTAWGIYIEKQGKHNNRMYCGESDESMNGELYKTAKSVNNFFNDSGRLYLDYSNLILMHTRNDTKGTPDTNENNHPFRTQNFILSHNGIISNDDTLAKKYNITPKIECDSYIIVALIQKFHDEGMTVVEAIKKTVEEIYGSFACWLYHKDKSELYLFRNTSPISYYMDSNNKTFMFASESNHIHTAYSLDDEVKDKIQELPSNKIFKLGKDGLEEVGDLSSSDTETWNRNTYASQVNGRQNTQSYQNRNIPSRLTEINGSLEYLYEYLESFEKDGGIRFVESVVRNEILLLVEPEDAIKTLDWSGFVSFKSDKKVLNDKFCKYNITPKETINKLVRNLKDYLKNDKNFISIDGGGELEESFRGGLEDLVDSIKCEFEETKMTYKFSYSDTINIEPDVEKMFQKVGFKFKNDNTLVLSKSKYHRRRLNDLLNKLGLWDGRLNE